ncbi:hypothetical protein VPJ68_06370, partial [Parabacteroides distasonis]
PYLPHRDNPPYGNRYHPHIGLEALPFLPIQYEDGTYSRKGDYPGAEDTENPVRIFKAQRHKIKHAKEQAKIKQQEEDLDMARHKHSLRIMLAAGVALLVILLMISYVVYRRRGNVKILSEKNHRLKEELEKVNRSNRTKEEFLVQMMVFLAQNLHVAAPTVNHIAYHQQYHQQCHSCRQHDAQA